MHFFPDGVNEECSSSRSQRWKGTLCQIPANLEQSVSPNFVLDFPSGVLCQRRNTVQPHVSILISTVLRENGECGGKGHVLCNPFQEEQAQGTTMNSMDARSPHGLDAKVVNEQRSQALLEFLLLFLRELGSHIDDRLDHGLPNELGCVAQQNCGGYR